MAFYALDKSKATVKSGEGRVYLLKVLLDDGKIVYKIGMCNSDRSTDRMMEILQSFFKVYRYIPRCELKRDRKATDALDTEQKLHSKYEKYSFKFDKKFGGSTEFFYGINEDEVLLDYEDIL